MSREQHTKDRAPRLFPLCVVFLAYTLRFWQLGSLSLIGDEAYYWLWSHHLAWAYYDHPAGTALLVRAGTMLGGSTELGVRWLNALLGVIAVLLTARLGQALLSRRAGWFGAALVAVGAPYLITSRFVYTDALHLTLLLLNLLAFWRLTRPRTDRGAALSFGVSLALLFNTKYSAYFYAVALLIIVLLDHRHLLRTRRLWTGAAIAVLGLLPVFAWNAAHDWASFRWQISHATLTLSESPSLLGKAYHAWSYLTPPLVSVGLLGLGRWRTSAERLLTLVILCLLAPMALSPTSSPRNLSTGLVPLLLLAGTRIPPLSSRADRALATLLTLGLLLATLYGVGTVVNLTGPSFLPSSSVVPAIVRDAAGWSTLSATLANRPGPFFALDYSLAAQLRYYTGRPVFTSWGQYRVWGLPDLTDVTVVALDYLPADWITRQLTRAFDDVTGPERLTLKENGASKVVHLWRAEGLRWNQPTFLKHFDFLTLVKGAP